MKLFRIPLRRRVCKLRKLKSLRRRVCVPATTLAYPLRKGISVPFSQSKHILVTVGWLCGFAYSLDVWRLRCDSISSSVLYTTPLTLSIGNAVSCSLFVLICCVIMLSYSLKRPASIVFYTSSVSEPKNFAILRVSFSHSHYFLNALC